MNIRQRIANIIDPPQRNSAGAELAADFMRYGVRTPAMPDWHWEMLDEHEKYTGYLYGAIIRRANKVAWLASYNLRTGANDDLMESAKAEESELTHPYLELIDESPTFANDQFWREIQTFIDLRGVYYVLVIRGKVGGKVGDIKEFKLLNPYNVIEVWDKENMQIIGYTETLEGMSREIPPHMIIRMKPLNPFSKIKPWSLADAATSAQYGLKETMDQITTGSRRNRKYPGVIMLGGNNVALDPEQVENWKARMAGKGRDGEPMFASAGSTNGAQSDIKWNDMQVDMRKSDIKNATDIQIDALSAVTGLSKTKFGIEQSGTTRDTAAIQDDLFVLDHAMPALQLILDALNQDYKTNYPDDYKTNGYFLYIESPLGEDKDAELTAVTNRINTYDLYQDLINKGYDETVAARYAMGDKDVDELGLPTKSPQDTPDTPPTKPAQDPTVEPPVSLRTSSLQRRMPLQKGQVRCQCCDGYGVHDSGYRCEKCKGRGSVAPPEANSGPCAGALAAHQHHHDDLAPVIMNRLETKDQSTIETQEAALKNSIINIDKQLVAAALTTVAKNAFDSKDDVVPESEQQQAEKALDEALEAFYAVVLPIAAASTMTRRMQEFGKVGTFGLDPQAQRYITLIASRAASSHVETVLGDILNTVRATEERLIQDEMKKIEPKPGQTSEDVLAEARRLALQGPGRQQLVAAITQKYSDSISTTRATTIARTETARAFNRAQYEADRQFLQQNDLAGRAYKKFITRSGNPCPICQQLASEPPIPFTQNFASIGETLTGTYTTSDGGSGVRSLPVSFEDITAGNVHPNCQCTYQLIIE